MCCSLHLSARVLNPRDNSGCGERGLALIACYEKEEKQFQLWSFLLLESIAEKWGNFQPSHTQLLSKLAAAHFSLNKCFGISWQTFALHLHSPAISFSQSLIAAVNKFREHPAKKCIKERKRISSRGVEGARGENPAAAELTRGFDAVVFHFAVRFQYAPALVCGTLRGGPHETDALLSHNCPRHTLRKTSVREIRGNCR